MTPDPTQDHSALRWIRAELDETLRQARLQLEDFVEQEVENLDACIGHLHQVHGSLELVQVYGGAMLADELEELAKALAEDRVARRDAAAEVLMMGMVQLPAYLERIESGEPDIPLILLPLLNDLRASRNAPLVSEISLFAPKLDSVIAAEEVVLGSGNPALPEQVRAQRPNYHRGLLNWYREADTKLGLQQIRDVIEHVASQARTARLRRLLDASEALVVALQDDSLDASVAVKLLFGQLDRVFKLIIDQGEEAAAREFPLELLKNQLYYIARSDSDDPVVQAVRRSADLANSFPDISYDEVKSGQLGGPGKALFDAVGDALRNDLREIKDHLDLYMRGERNDFERLGGLVDPVRRVGDTLGMVGRGELRSRLMPHCDNIAQLVDSQQAPSDDQLMTLAGDLLYVESALSALDQRAPAMQSTVEVDADAPLLQAMSDGEFREHVQAAINQAFVELAKTKDAILQYLAAPGKLSVLEDIPPRLHNVAGALTIMQQPEAARLLEDLRGYVHDLAAGARELPDQEQRESLADLVSGVEFHMESLVDRRPDQGHALQVAQAASRRLGLAEEEGAEQAPLSEEATGEAEHPAPQAAEAAQVAAADKPALDDIDSEILDIFIEEAREELAAIQENYPRWRADAEQQEPLTRVRRAFHTLKGSGRLVGAKEIGEFAWSVENLLNRVIDGTVDASHDIFELLDSVIEVLPRLIDERERGDAQGTPVDALSERAFLLASKPVQQAQAERPLQAVEAGAPVDEPPEPLAAETVEPAPAVQPPAPEPELPEPEVLELEPEEAAPAAAEEEIVAVEAEAPQPPEQPAVEVLELEPAEQALVEPEAPSLASPLDSDELELVEEELVLEGPAEAGEESLDIESVLSDSLLTDSQQLEDSTELAADEAVLELAEEDEDEPVESILMPLSEEAPPIALDATLHEIFANETQTHLATIGQFVENCRGVALGCVFSDELKRAMHTLRGSAHMAEVEPIAELAGTFENWVNLAAQAEMRTDSASIDLLERAHFVFNALLGVINQAGASMPAWQPLQREVQALAEQLEERLNEADVDSQPSEEIAHDPELIGIFMEEAHELGDGMEREMEQWRSRPDDLLPVAQLQRQLHTIKGGARLAGLLPVGDLSHAMESLFESIVERRIEAGDDHRGLARHALDALAAQIEALDKGQALPDQGAMVERLEAAASGKDWAPLQHAQAPGETQPPASGEAPTEAPAEPPSVVDDSSSHLDDSTLLSDSQLLTDSELLGDSEFTPPSSMMITEVGDGSMLYEDSRIIQFPARGRHAEEAEEAVRRPPPPEEEEEKPAGSRERIRVRAELLDQMVNNAGEVSIYRARLEQQNKTQGYNLDELAQTIERLRAQLRNLELETEAQILSRYEREYEGEVPAGFDPLEMDRYSTIQQLSRALSETVNDLSNIGVTLQEMNRDSDTLLLQQDRVTKDLQDGLLRTRMVPVLSRTARLQRVVRQTSHSLGKQAELSIIGGEGEMDRAILERMMAPLEHLLRNAVAHGIESPEERAAAGKPAEGTVSLVMSREGADVVLTISDDGRGLDRAAIRKKAIERGLLDRSAHIDDEDLDQFILEAGFSTADAVSQIAGRGVGMDVVLSEVKQLGGTLEITSQPGRGSSFLIRLPFTLAITESLLVTAGEEVYAVPHSSMDGVVRIPRADLEACYRGERDNFSYGGRDYTVRYLGSMLSNARPLLPEGERWFPLLLVRSGEHRVAIHVDGLLGNRQIVVKSVGAQLSTVRWFTGGTILADGRIALIFDINSLVRMDSAHHQPQLLAEPEQQAHSVKVMVVDDSITVRKVTSRLLERHNMQVLTAKDGVDAVAMLQDEKPDVMLLDIEMPRMDGFELARHMRSSEHLKDIPIIMITSRTGDKHRTHAMDLGVKRYLGKPYQESDLLENIYTVLAESGDE